MATRRELLKAGATTGLMALIPSVSFLPTAAAARLRPTSPVVPLSRSIFRELLFDDFRLATSRVGVQLRLLEIRDLASRSMPESENAFSLHFLATPSAPLEQGTYALVHPRRGRFDLFLVPMGGGELPAYEAVINNLQIPVGPTRGRTARPRA